jgi:uncharacterized membrane protein
MGELNDLFKFLWKAKMWFIIPFIILLIVFGLLVFFAQATGVAPFIYSII